MNRKILIVAIITLFFDQLSKVIIEMLIALNEEVILIKNSVCRNIKVISTGSVKKL